MYDEPDRVDAHTLTFDDVDIAHYDDVKLHFMYNVIEYDADQDFIEYELFFDGIGQGAVELPLGATGSTNGWLTETVDVPDSAVQVGFVLSATQDGGNDYAGYDNIRLTGTFVPFTIDKDVTPATDVDYHGLVTYTVVIANHRLVSDTNAIFTDTLPDKVDFAGWIEQPDGASETGDEITWSGTLTNNSAITFTFSATHNGTYEDVVDNTAEYSGSVAISDQAAFTVAAEEGNITFIYHDLEDVVRGAESVCIAGDVVANIIPVTSCLGMDGDIGLTTFTATIQLTARGYDYHYVVTNTVDGPQPLWLNTGKDLGYFVYGDATREDYRLVRIDEAQLIPPHTLRTKVNTSTPDASGRVNIDEATDPAGEGRGIVAQVGYGDDPDPANWTWFPMTFDTDNGIYDQFKGVMTPTVSGFYSYAVRFSGNWGSDGADNPNHTWTYADIDGGPFNLNNTGVLTSVLYDVDISKSVTPESVWIRDGKDALVTYTIEVRNLSTLTSTNLTTIEDTLPDGCTYIADTSGTTPTGDGSAGDPLRWIFGSLDPGDSISWAVVVSVTDAITVTGLYTNTAMVTADPPDWVSGNDTASASVMVYRVLSLPGVRERPDGETVVVEGYVNFPTGLLHGAGSDEFMFQDAALGTSGLDVYYGSGEFTPLGEGAKVLITGEIDTYNGRQRIIPTSASDVYTTGPAITLIPVVTDTGAISEAIEGVLVEITGRITGNPSSSTMYVDDGTGQIQVYRDLDTGISLAEFNDGDCVHVRGVATQNYTYQVMPRYQSDLTELADLLCVTSSDSVAISGPTVGMVNTAFVFTATVSPVTATTPITYEWQISGSANQQIITHTGGVSDTAVISWTTDGAVSATHTITITITPPTFTLTVNVVGQGTVDLDPSGGSYGAGTVVTLTAVLTSNWHFAGWSGDLNSADNPETLTMDGHKVVTATFSTVQPTTYTLTVNIVGQGTVMPTAGTHSYISGTVVGMEAAPGIGWQFDGWSGALSGATSPTGLTMDADKVVTATFEVAACPIALTGVSVSGPTNGYTDTLYTFRGSLSPANPTQPVMLTWTPAPISGQGALTATYQWATPDMYPIMLTAENCGDVVTDTHVIVITSTSSSGDYEPNDTCAQGKFIETNGLPQVHSFYEAGDEDWVAFYATAGITCVVQARVPPASSADLMLELYNTCTPGEPSFDDENPTFNPDIRFSFVAPDSGIYYLRLFNYISTMYGADVVYHLSVQALENIMPAGAVILVAGRYRDGDPLQQNIYNVTDALYDYVLNQGGCEQDQIAYLAPEARPGTTGLATKIALQETITQWAAGQLEPGQSLTLYMFDHGRVNGFYLDGVSGQLLSPMELDGWLDLLQAAVPGVEVNVIIEACYSGSFIQAPESLGGDGRVVIASTTSTDVAYASDTGAAFSDVFLNSLKQTPSLWTAFDEGVWGARMGHPDQAPWLDDTGNGLPNEAALDGQLAAQRAFACTVNAPQENWPPHIAKATFEYVVGNQVRLWAVAQDDEQVKGMWSLIYPPSWQRLKSSEEMIADPTPVILPQSQGGFGGEYVLQGGVEIGMYHVVFHAQDGKDLTARPFQVKVCTGDACVEPESPQTFRIPVDALTTTVHIPASAVTATTAFIYTPTTSAPDTAPPGYVFAGRGFDLTAYQWGQPQPDFIFQRPITITTRYSDADVAALDEDTLVLYYWDGAEWLTDGVTIIARHTDANHIVVTADHLTEFALFGKKYHVDVVVYLPLVLRQ